MIVFDAISNSASSVLNATTNSASGVLSATRNAAGTITSSVGGVLNANGDGNVDSSSAADSSCEADAAVAPPPAKGVAPGYEAAQEKYFQALRQAEKIHCDPGLPEQLINSAFVAQQPEGLSFAMKGPLLTSAEQQITLAVRMKGRGGEMQHVLDVIVAEEAVDKGILMQTGEALPVCYLDTRNHKAQRRIDIYDHIPDSKSMKESPVACVRETGDRSFDLASVLADGKPGQLWLKIQYLGDCANFVDASGALRATMRLLQKDGEDNRTMYSVEVSQSCDASVILSGLIAAIKIG